MVEKVARDSRDAALVCRAVRKASIERGIWPERGGREARAVSLDAVEMHSPPAVSAPPGSSLPLFRDGAESGGCATAVDGRSTTAAHRSDERIRIGGGEQPIAAVYSRFTALASATGQPALTVPVGTDSEALPSGAQFIGRDYSQAQLGGIGAVVESRISFDA